MSKTVADLTTGLQTRDLIPGTAVRAAAASADDRGVSGIAVPWDETIEFWGIREEFAPGSVTVEDDNPPQLFWRHQEVIGGLTSWCDDAAGWHIDAAISDTTLGRDAHALAKDGHVRKFSIGFQPLEWEELHDKDAGTITLRYTKVLAREVSLVPHPAYSSASITETRQKEYPVMPDTQAPTVEDLAEVREELTTVTRRLDLIDADPATREEPNPLLAFRSFGEYAKALAAGDATAARAFEGAVSGDFVAKDGWVGDIIRLGEERQRITRLFQHTKDLPGQGMNVEYGVLEANTITVEEQEAEGDDLVYGKLAIGTATAPVKTLGGWTDLSRQAIERTSVNVLDFTFRALYLAYARAVETLTRATLDAAYAASGAGALAEVEGDLTTQDGVLAALIDLVEHFEDDPMTNLSGLLVSKDVFLDLAAVEANDRILQVARAPQDRLGTLTLSSLTGDIAGVPVTIWPGADAGSVLAYDELAIRTQEAPGAPARLQDENIVNLTKAYSVYGYVSSYAQVPAGLVKVTAPTAG